MRLRYTGPASRDLAALLDYTEQHWSGNIQQVLARIDDVERLLAEFPTIGPSTIHHPIRQYSLRPLPYVLYYRLSSDEIQILRIYHAAQTAFDPRTA